MSKILLTLVATLIVAVFGGTAFAYDVPTPTGFVTDTAGILSPSDKAALTARLNQYNRSTQNEIEVLVVRSLGGDSIEDAAQSVFKGYGIGKAGLDNGVLFMVSVGDRKMRIQTGKGVEGDLPDLVCSDILSTLKPFFKTGNWAGGINHGLDLIQSKLESRAGQKADPGQGAQFNQQVAPNADNTVNGTTAPHASNHSSCQAVPGDDSEPFVYGAVAILILLIVFFLYRRFTRVNRYYDSSDNGDFSSPSYTPDSTPSYDPPSFDPGGSFGGGDTSGGGGSSDF